MQKKIRCFGYIFLFVTVINFNFLKTAIVGSNSVVAVEGYVTFPEADNGTNEMRGFSAFDSGFELETFDTTCTFSSLFPVRDRINLNGGILYLQRDLIIGTTARIETVGGIYGNDYKLDFTTSITKLDFEVSRTFTLDNVIWNLGTDLYVDIPILIQGFVDIHGRNKTSFIELGPNGSIAVASGGAAEIDNIEIRGLKGTNLRCDADDAEIEFKNCKLVLDHDYEFIRGKLEIEEGVVVTGTNTFLFSSSTMTKFETNSEFFLDLDVTFSYAPTSESNNLIFLEDETATIFFNGSTLCVSSTGLCLTIGTIVIDNQTHFKSDATTEGEGIIFGDGVSASSNVHIDINANASLVLDSGYLIFNNV